MQYDRFDCMWYLEEKNLREVDTTMGVNEIRRRGSSNQRTTWYLVIGSLVVGGSATRLGIV